MRPGTRNTIEAWLLVLMNVCAYIVGIIIGLYILKIAFRFVVGV